MRLGDVPGGSTKFQAWSSLWEAVGPNCPTFRGPRPAKLGTAKGWAETLVRWCAWRPTGKKQAEAKRHWEFCAPRSTGLFDSNRESDGRPE